MGIINKIFGKKKNESPKVIMEKSFEPGDIFYIYHDNQYHFYKLLHNDTANGTYHVLGYKAMSTLPENNRQLTIAFYHAPINSTGFTNPIFFSKSRLVSDDMIGYVVYLEEMGQVDERFANAELYYLDANALAGNKQYVLALEKYSLAIQFVPTFFEAIDNRAFTFMDLGRWEDAIIDFEQSLIVNPDGPTATFSIGECYLRLENYPKAKEYFQKAQIISPEKEHIPLFLAKVDEAMKG